MAFKKYNVNMINASRFYQLPKFLLEDANLRKMSNDAKLLYAILRDRLDLSISNNWIDKNGNVYIIFTRVEMCEKLGCGKEKITKICNELKAYNLFEEVRVGLNKPNIIYLNYIETEEYHSSTPSSTTLLNEPQSVHKEEENHQNTYEKRKQTPSNKEVRKSNFQRFENRTFGSSKIELPEVRKSNLINTNINHTDINDTNINQSINHYSSETQNEIDMIDMIDNANEEEFSCDDILQEYQACEKLIKNNIDYEILKQDNSEFTEFMDEVVQIMVDTCCSKAKTIRIGKTEKPTALVKSMLFKIKNEHINSVYDAVKKNKSKVTNPKNYILTSLINSLQTYNIKLIQDFNHYFN